MISRKMAEKIFYACNVPQKFGETYLVMSANDVPWVLKLNMNFSLLQKHIVITEYFFLKGSLGTLLWVCYTVGH